MAFKVHLKKHIAALLRRFAGLLWLFLIHYVALAAKRMKYMKRSKADSKNINIAFLKHF